MMNPRFLLLFWLFAVHFTSAQQFQAGYLKLRESGEHAGLIGKLTLGPPDMIEYKASDSDEVKTFRADEIDGYGLAGSRYFSSFLNPDGSWTFVELLADGQLTLVIRNSFYFLIDREAKKVVNLEKGFVRYLRAMTRNCPWVSARSSKVKLTTESLTEIVNLYNQCVTEKNPNRDGMPRPASLTVSAGVDYSFFTFSKANEFARYLSGRPADKSLFQVGMDLTLRSYNVSNHFGLFVGGFYNSNSYGGVRKIVYQERTEIHEFTLDFIELKIPVGIEWSPPQRGRFSYHVRGGCVFRSVTSLKSTHPLYEADPNSNGAVYIEEPGQLQYFKPGPQAMITFGFDYRLLARSRIRIQFGASTGSVTIGLSNAGQATQSGTYTSFNSMVGLTF